MDHLARGEKIIIGMVGLPARGKVKHHNNLLPLSTIDLYFSKNRTISYLEWIKMRSV